MDFNSQLDNGVYNKFVENSPKNNEDGEKALEELVSHESVLSNPNHDEELNLKQLEMLINDDKRRNAGENLLSDETYKSNYSFVIEEDVVEKVVQYGYPNEYVVRSLLENEANYCTATYYLLKQDQNY